ncbi:hypothetical protein AA958_14150 [Streptomyces sp. CNQ-509]|uniref:hypothetical protein n=1 Tax=Streptomyces sp. CNQ-509 TaxID=444103 RepID=UPI00062E0A55|nr:hypothetical protein [Streptomyces sp. CNQ-509]AKH83184.1 hypothetical protein AA958_14150 [Streptomyces sp. CNQ-509]
MLDRIASVLDPLLRLLWPATGRRRYLPSLRAAAPVLFPYPVPAPPAPAAPPPDRHAPDRHAPATPRVRPYVLAHERRAEARRQRARRLELWLAVHGVDVGPRLIHGVEVPA